MFQFILFDLDGTLTDPREGITKSVQFALLQQGIREPDLKKLEPFIGPPLRDSFMDFYDMTMEQADRAIVDYRKRFAPIGLLENKVYPGIPEMLEHLKEAGIRLAVASSKPETFVRQILEHFHLDHSFEVVVGGNMDGSRSEKDEVVEEALHRLGEPDGKGAMVGDRKYDIRGGQEHGLTTVGVSFGYAGKGELEKAGADYIAGSVKELEAILLSGGKSKKKGRKAKKAAESEKAPESEKTAQPAKAEGPAKKAEPAKPHGRPERRAENGSASASVPGKAWHIMFPFLLYYLGSNACYIVIVTLFRLVLESGAGFEWMHENSVGIANLAKACSMLAGAAVLLVPFRKQQTAWQARTQVSYPTMGILAVSSAFGVNLLFGLLQIAAMSVGYYEVERMQYQIPFLPGLILYGLISPLAEEMLFRGLIYNRMKACFSLLTSGIASSALFGLYHGNLVQALYGLLMGLLFSYAYELTGNFKIPVMMHGLANICVFAASYASPAGAGMAAGTPVYCTVCLLASVLCLVRVQKKRRPLGQS